MTGGQNDNINNHLAAFAFADVADYSRHMAVDGSRTVRNWERMREDILLVSLETFSGRAVSMPGDALLVEFSSAAGAVNWALDVQSKLRQRAPAEGQLHLRIGINVDDVFDDGETLQSDGVVIASRILQLAAPGEVVITQLARDIVRGRVNATFRDLGMPALKNINRPIRLFAVSDKNTDDILIRPHVSWSSRPTLAVLPFTDYGNDEANRYFAEGITEEIITGICRSRALFVVARSSALQISEKVKSQKEIAGALGVKYLLGGSVQRSSEKLRIHTALIDVDFDKTLWAERFDGRAVDLFEFQDKIVASIVAALEPKVMKAEADHLSARATENLDAYDCVLRALSEFYRVDEAGYSKAFKLFSRAVKLDPGYAQAHAYLAWCLNFIIAEGYSQNAGDDRQSAIEHARIAVDLDAEDAFNLSVRGHVMGLLEGRPHEAVDLLEEAVRLNENLPLAWALSATSYAYLGNGDETKERLLNVWRLTPYDPLNFFFWTAGGLGEFVAERYDEAIVLLQRARRIKPHFAACLRILAASLALSGERKLAEDVAADLLQQDPGFSIAKFMAWYPIIDPKVRENLILGLGAAGLPK